MLSTDDLKDAIAQKLAADYLAAMTPEEQGKLLAASLTSYLKDYSFRHTVEKALNDRVSQIAAELAQDQDWSVKIRRAIEAGFADYVASLRVAVAPALQECLHGDGTTSYNKPGRILGKWPQPAKAEV